MAELVKQWNDGGSLSVSYNGDGDGSAVFSSETNEGIDRETGVTFIDSSRSIVIDKKIKQVGKRQIFSTSDTSFKIADGGTFNVLKGSYTPIDYIQSTGMQYIDTLYIPNENTELEMYVSGITKDSFSLSAGGTWFFGGRAGYLNKAFGSYYNANNNTIYYARGNIMPNAKYTSLYNADIVFKATKTGLYINGNKVVNITSGAFTSPVNLILFGLNNNGDAISFTGYRMHYCKIFDGIDLVRDFIPVLDKENIVCMYDKVSSNFFYNKGGGAFIGGNIV